MRRKSFICCISTTFMSHRMPGFWISGAAPAPSSTGCGSSASIVSVSISMNMWIIGRILTVRISHSPTTQWRNSSDMTIENDTYTLPFPDCSFDIVHSTTVLEHVADLEIVLRECHQVLTPQGVCLHFYPGRFKLVEPHIAVPLASFFHPPFWLALWARWGVCNEFQNSLTWRAVAESNIRYFETGLFYRSRSEIISAAKKHFKQARIYSPRRWSPGYSILNSDEGNDEGAAPALSVSRFVAARRNRRHAVRHAAVARPRSPDLAPEAMQLPFRKSSGAGVLSRYSHLKFAPALPDASATTSRD